MSDLWVSISPKDNENVKGKKHAYMGFFNLQYLEQCLLLKMYPTNLCLINKTWVNNNVQFKYVVYSVYKLFYAINRSACIPSIKKTRHLFPNSHNYLIQWRLLLHLRLKAIYLTLPTTILLWNTTISLTPWLYPTFKRKSNKWAFVNWYVLRTKKRNDLWNSCWTSPMDFVVVHNNIGFRFFTDRPKRYIHSSFSMLFFFNAEVHKTEIQFK